jgi:opacity protein-like surface antigen
MASLAAAAVVVLFLASASHAAAMSSPTPGRAQVSSLAAVAQAYYAAVNQRDWPRAWQLAGGNSRGYGTAAYRQWVGGYTCTVRDHVTKITVKGNSLLVLVRALETGGITQDYKFSYVVRHGVLTHPRMLSYTGHAPQGCGR